MPRETWAPQVTIRRGDPEATGDVVVEGVYEVGLPGPPCPGPDEGLAEPCSVARLRYRHHATTGGDLVKVEAEILLDGGAHPPPSPAAVGTAARFAAGPYRVPNVVIDATVACTDDPPGGATGHLGAVPVGFGHESQMDRLATAVGIDPVELRLRNALESGDVLPTGQVLGDAARVAERIRAAVAHPLPPDPYEPGPGPGSGSGSAVVDEAGWLALPGGLGRTADPGRVRRGVGLAAGFADEGFVVAAHRAVVDVDVDLGLVRVVQVATAADAAAVLTTGDDVPEPEAPPGASGVGEPPLNSSTAAVVAAIRAASGVDVTRLPVHPWDLV